VVSGPKFNSGISVRDVPARVGVLVVMLFLLTPQDAASGDRASRAQEESRNPNELWFMRETAMDANGRLTFLDKPWWPRARQLTEGKSFTLDLNGDGRPDTVVERVDGNLIEAIDDTGHASNILNRVSTAYLVSYGGTGLVDRMVAYIDNDGDGKCEEMEIRYYQDGYLRFAWFAENYDHDGAQLFDLKNWQYSGNGFASKFRGNVLMYLNKYDPSTGHWVPLAECPFAFLDPNHDGFAQIVLRVSAVPKLGVTPDELDYANNPAYRFSPSSPKAEDIVMGNLRLSYSLDPEPRYQGPHFTFGFTMVGAAPYQTTGRLYTNPRRRPPQTVVRLPWEGALETALHYEAQETGLSWDEHNDQHRWEGQFWIWERRLLENTGNPVYRWNMRREYSPHPSTARRLYYSGVDKRYHFFGAVESWLEVGHLVNNKKDLEIRAYDSNGDGYLDTWEVFCGDNPVPVRTTRVLNQKITPVPLDREFLVADYNTRVLPQAIADDEQLISAMKGFVSLPLARRYEEEAARATSSEAKRYSLDIARELYFLKLRDALYARDSTALYPGRPEAMTDFGGLGEPIRLPVRSVFLLSLRSFWHVRGLLHATCSLLKEYTYGDTAEFWHSASQTRVFVDDYGNGDFAAATRDLHDIDPRALVPDPLRLVPYWTVVGGAVMFGVCVLYVIFRRRQGVSLRPS
jgi:hypothetical protein